MLNDPIVAEIHRIREEICREFNYDLNAYFEHLYASQSQRKGHPLQAIEESIKRTEEARTASVPKA